MATVAMTPMSEIVVKSLARPMKSKLVPGLTSSRNGLWVAMVGASDGDGGGLAAPAHVVVEEQPRTPHLGEERGEDADQQHDREALERTRAVLVEDVARRRRGQLAVEDG